MAVLVQYSDYDSLMLEDLVRNTGIVPDIMTQLLSMLTKAKILLQDKEDGPYNLNTSKFVPFYLAL